MATQDATEAEPPPATQPTSCARPAAPDGPGADVLVALSGLRHPHLAPVGPAVPDGPVVVEPVPGRRLDELRAATGPFTEEETATVVVPIAQALGALHGAGLAHGGPNETCIVVRADGMPVLADLSTVQVGTATVRADLHALVACAVRLLPDEEVYVAAAVGPGCLRSQLLALLDQEALIAEDLVDACFRSVDPTPLRRPLASRGLDAGATRAQVVGPVAEEDGPARAPRDAAGQAADLLRAAARAERADVPPVRGGPRTRRGTRGTPRRPGRTRPLLGLGLLVVTGALWYGLGAWHPGRSAEAVLASKDAPAVTTSAQPDPALAAVELTRRRAELLADPAAADLAQVEVVDGPAYRADAATVADLAGVRNVGLQVEVQDARTRSIGADGAAYVLVTSATSDYARTTADGAVSQLPAAGPRTVELELRWTEAGWRVWSVSGSTTP